MKRFVTNAMTTLEYDWWWAKRVNDNVPLSNQENIGRGKDAARIKR
ncbi:hypothetical protein Gotri_014949 [Gossypium trilobum]|uniref:Uncharacterized protein n=1 Tax=Gossypium trilobum TaxID=34281 RepID=A0A7J9DZR3_9ROSI|nr:hypothetical protein [Gossypium trilobum]